MWRDEPSFADAFSGYYTDLEPESATVATIDDRVVGYLLGCRDIRSGPPTRRWRSPATSCAGASRSGPGTAPMIWRSVGDVATDLGRRRVRRATTATSTRPTPPTCTSTSCPTPGATGVGGRLVRRWLDRLRADGVPGCHLQTMAENTGAVAFFEAMGFERQGRPVLAPGERTRRASAPTSCGW